ELVSSISIGVCLVLVVADLALVAVTAVLLVDSIDRLVERTVLSQECVGLIFLPLAGDTSEHVAELLQTVTDNMEDRLDR
ncbi:hypothetical protein FRB96_007781, partial [Tulasnella sp. 330]